MRPQTKYAKSADVHIAYQVLGEGPFDLIFVPGWISHLELLWEDSSIARFLERLASFSRLIIFDKRGTGLSDRVADNALPTLEQRMDDVRAVMDAAGSERAALFGISEGGPMAALFAATYPARTSALVMYGTYAKLIRADDYPWAMTRAELEAVIALYEQRWGTPIGLKSYAPSVAGDESFRTNWSRYLRASASPAAAMALYRMNIEIDIRQVLPTIRVPTLVLHRSGDRLIEPGNGRFMAAQIPGARYIEMPGCDHLFWVGDTDRLGAEVQEFLTGSRPVVDEDSVLATVLFIDIVGSTERAAALGDGRWRELLDKFHELMGKQVAHFRGRVVDTAGDGVFATFDGPARAIRCARSVHDAAAALGLTLRSGLHTGECRLAADKVTGIAVHIGARVSALAGPGETLVSSTVKDLVAGSGLRFEDRGSHALKGVPGQWQLATVAAGG